MKIDITPSTEYHLGKTSDTLLKTYNFDGLTTKEIQFVTKKLNLTITKLLQSFFVTKSKIKVPKVALNIKKTLTGHKFMSLRQQTLPIWTQMSTT